MKNIKKIGLLLVLGVVGIGYVASTGALTRPAYTKLKKEFDVLAKETPSAANLDKMEAIIATVKKDKEYIGLSSTMAKKVQARRFMMLGSKVNDLKAELANAKESGTCDLSAANRVVDILKETNAEVQEQYINLTHEHNKLFDFANNVATALDLNIEPWPGDEVVLERAEKVMRRVKSYHNAIININVQLDLEEGNRNLNTIVEAITNLQQQSSVEMQNLITNLNEKSGSAKALLTTALTNKSINLVDAKKALLSAYEALAVGEEGVAPVIKGESSQFTPSIEIEEVD